MNVNEYKTEFGTVNVPMGYKYKHKVFFARKLLDLLHRLRCISTKQHKEVSTKVIFRRDYFETPDGIINP